MTVEQNNRQWALRLRRIDNDRKIRTHSVSHGATTLEGRLGTVRETPMEFAGSALPGDKRGTWRVFGLSSGSLSRELDGEDNLHKSYREINVWNLIMYIIFIVNISFFTTNMKPTAINEIQQWIGFFTNFWHGIFSFTLFSLFTSHWI